MKKIIFVQFRFSSNKVLRNLPKDITKKIEKQIKKSDLFSSISISEEEPLYNDLISKNILINNKSLIRLIHESIIIDEKDIDEEKYYELIFETEEVNLVSDPIKYYDVKIKCKHCESFTWTQKKDLEIKKDITKEIRVTNNNEILITKGFQKLLIKNKIENIDFRKTSKNNTIQLVLNDETIMQENRFLIKEGFCKECGKPRIVKYENTNNVSLFTGATNIPRIEYVANVELKKAVKDISYTNYEFGTVGTRPEGAPPSEDPYDYSFKSSEAKIIISGRLGKLIFKTNNKAFSLVPCT